jgi:hypothetical protein
VDIRLEEGERIDFPVDRDHPYFAFQDVQRIMSLDQVIGFEFVRLWAHFAGRRSYGDDRRLAQLREKAPEEVYRAKELGRRYPTFEAYREAHGFGDIVKVSAVDFIVPAGSTIVMSNGMNRIVANRATIAGTLRSTGHLLIEANELGG